MATSTSQSKILNAATKLFTENGFEGTTTKEIAKRAKVNEVTLFRLFESKQQLFNAVVNKMRIEPELDMELAAYPGFSEFMIALGHRLYDKFSKNLNVVRFHLKNNKAPIFPHSVVKANILKYCALKNIPLVDDIAEMLAISFISSILGMIVNVRIWCDIEPEEDFIYICLELFVKGVSIYKA